MKEPFYLLFALLLTNDAFAQENPGIDKVADELNQEMHKLNSGYLDPSSVVAEDLFIERRLKAFLKYPESERASVDLPFDIATSDDGLLTIYTWDDALGSHGKRTYRKVFNFDPEKINLIRSVPLKPPDFYDYNGFTQGIYLLKTDPWTYLVISRSPGLLGQYIEDVRFYSTNGHTFSDTTDLILTREGLTDSVGIFCDINIDGNDDMQEKGMAAIRYDSKEKILYVPVILADGRITKAVTPYRFNGEYFEEMK